MNDDTTTPPGRPGDAADGGRSRSGLTLTGLILGLMCMMPVAGALWMTTDNPIYLLIFLPVALIFGYVFSDGDEDSDEPREPAKS